MSKIQFKLFGLILWYVGLGMLWYNTNFAIALSAMLMTAGRSIADEKDN